MNEADQARRKVIKNLLIAGFGIHLIGCTSASPTKEKSIPSHEKPEIDTLKVEQIVDEVLSTNVTYFIKEDEEFVELATYFNLETQKDPGIIALVVNEEGVSEAILHAKELNLPVSIKSGGHSFEQFSSNNGGLVINLSLLNTIEWSDAEHIKAGPACLLKETYDFTLPEGRILPAGSCGSVGLGGLTLGGGYGLFARAYGLTCDQLVSATFVDGNGEIHHLGPENEILWALKGGGNGNFGVVTSLTLKTHPAPTEFSTTKFKAYKLDSMRAKELLQTWFEVAHNLPNDCFSAFVLNGRSLTILVTYFRAKSDGLVAMEEALSPICDKTTTSFTKDIPKALKRYYGIQYPIYFKNASAGYYSEFSEIDGCIDDVLSTVVTTPGLIYQINTLGGAINSQTFDRKSCYPHREYYYLSELQSYWNEGQDKQRTMLLTAFKKIQSLFYENGNRAQYRNYPSIEFSDWESSYYGSNYKRLQSFKDRLDPENTIRHEQSVKLVKEG
ncbi:MAG: hypothetical protein ACI865_003032 [Flavobacteriaceae bacterium]|jgi:hypothetical protein